MELLVVSDSHGMTSGMKAALQEHPKITHIIHLGDGEAEVAALRQQHPLWTVDAVRGNCDVQRKLPLTLLLTVAGHRIFATHGNCYGVKYGLDSLVAEGLHEQADIILFGHTHQPLIERRDGLLIVNPGSIAGPWVAPRATYAILALTPGAAAATPFTL